jgi:serine/threonine protein kinase
MARNARLPTDLRRSGECLGKYELIRRLAVGGMAELFLARPTDGAASTPLVALKRLLPHYATQRAIAAWFLDRARSSAALRHPNVVPIYEIGADGGSYFFAMEYVRGADLRQLTRLRRKLCVDLPLAYTLHIARGVAAGLDYAHECRAADGAPLNIVHGSVCPTNVLVSFDGSAKLSDFGGYRSVARESVGARSDFTARMGYMSPEQCRGETPDHRSDIYGLGVLLYELTTGTRLHGEADEVAVLRRTLEGELDPPSSRRLCYPPRLEAIVMRALACDPSQRYANARELIGDIEGYARESRFELADAALGDYMRALCAEKHVVGGVSPSEPVLRSSQPPPVPANSRSTSREIVNPVTRSTGSSLVLEPGREPEYEPAWTKTPVPHERIHPQRGGLRGAASLPPASPSRRGGTLGRALVLLIAMGFAVLVGIALGLVVWQAWDRLRSEDEWESLFSARARGHLPPPVATRKLHFFVPVPRSCRLLLRERLIWSPDGNRTPS